MAGFIVGAAELEALLKQLPERVAKNVTTTGLRAGARIIAKAARDRVQANPSVDSGLLAKNITSRARKRSRKGSAVVSVGVRGVKQSVVRKGKTKATFANPSRYAHFVEFGTKPRFQEKTGRYTGQMRAEPFLRPALDEKAGEAIIKIGESMGRGVEREAAKLAAGKTSFVTGRRIK